MTKALAANGAHKVYIVGRRKEKLEEAAKLAPEIIIPIQGDVTSKESLQSMAKQVKDDAGYVNILIANSGVMGPTNAVKVGEGTLAEYAKAGFEQSWDGFNSTMNVNVTAVMFTAYAFMELLDAGNKKNVIPSTKSQILITASIAGFSKAPNLSIAYKTSKAAVTLLAKTLCSELVPYGIRCNSLAPGGKLFVEVALRLFQMLT